MENLGLLRGIIFADCLGNLEETIEAEYIWFHWLDLGGGGGSWLRLVFGGIFGAGKSSMQSLSSEDSGSGSLSTTGSFFW